MPDELEERLRSHARSFDSLLSLIPAKDYVGEDGSNQWNRKRQTPEERKAAKLAKLDPANWKSAKDLIDERAAAALKRKREGNGEHSEVELTSDLGEGRDKTAKKRKTVSDEKQNGTDQARSSSTSSTETEEERKQRRAALKATKRERKRAKKAKLQEKKKNQKLNKKASSRKQPRERPNPKESLSGAEDDESEEGEDDDEEMAEAIDIEPMSIDLIGAPEEDASSTAPSTEHEESPILSPQVHSGTSSISSIQPAPIEPPIPPKSTIFTETAPSPLPNDEHRTARERLDARISLLRAERKADERPARNRQELLEQRRKKEEERKTAKKEQRRKQKEEEARQQDEEIAKRFSPGGSGSLLASPRSPMVESGNNFTFGRVAFADGTHADASLSSLLDAQKKRRGPSDPATALKAAEHKASRLAGLDEAKRTTIAEQEMWLNAKRRAHGERVRDDTSLLKKALKRKEGGKKKSEKEWQQREEGVKGAMDKRQKRREENIAKRRDEKHSGGGGAGKSKHKGKPGKKVKRPGFEGSFKGRTGGGKRNAK